MPFCIPYRACRLATRLAACLAAAGWIGGCANMVAPTGGEGDKTPPVFIGSVPAPGSTGVRSPRAELWFSEPLKAGAAYGQEVVVSPLPARPPRVQTQGQRVRVRLRDPLRDSTTYVIAVAGVADFRGGNKLAAPARVAFSTGPVVDSLRVEGRIATAVAGEAAAEMLVMLFMADSVLGPALPGGEAGGTRFWGKRPLYVARTDAEGRYALTNLRRARYALLAVKDLDKSYSWNAANEDIALAPRPDLAFADTASEAQADLVAFRPDARPPQVRAQKTYAPGTLALVFSETPDPARIRLWRVDSTLRDSVPLHTRAFAPATSREWLFALPDAPPPGARLRIRALTDSLGNAADTLFALAPRPADLPSPPLWAAPFPVADSLGRSRYAVVFAAPVPDSLRRLAFVGDTLRTQPSAVQTEWDGFQLFISPSQGRDSFACFLTLPSAMFPGWRRSDTLLRYPLLFRPAPEGGSLSGRVRLHGYAGPVVLRLFKAGGEAKMRGNAAPGPPPPEYTALDTAFDFARVLPGTYRLEVVLDADGNGRHTPGSVNPYRLPERIWRHPEPIEIKPGWDIEALEIDLHEAGQAPTSEGRPTGKGGKGGVNAPDAQNAPGPTPKP